MIAESTALLSQLENSLGVPTVAFFANWAGEYAVDADEEAGRLLTQMMVERLRQESSDALALVVGSRGGYPAFADAVLRTARHLDVELRVLLPCRVDGAASLIALAADQITLHPQAGVGPVDSGLCVVPKRELDASLFEHCPVAPTEVVGLTQSDVVEIARLTYDRFLRHHQRRMAQRFSTDADAFAVVEERLGRGGTIGCAELSARGIDARVAPAPLAEQLEELRQWGEQALHLFRNPEERFEFSGELANEVEFQPAMDVAAGAIVSIDRVWLHELDTGSPDPHAPRLMGQWRLWTSESHRDDDSGDEEE